MTYSNPYMVRDLSILLNDVSSPTNASIKSFIKAAESQINLELKFIYATPIRPKSYLSGTISGSVDSKTITGSGTSFTDLLPGQVIQIVGTGEVFEIAVINSDTSITAVDNITTAFTVASFWVIPEEFVTASKYLAAHLTIMAYFSEQAGNQDESEKFDTRLRDMAQKLIKELKSAKYLNTDLVQQSNTQSSQRLILINKATDLRELTDNNETEILDFI